jgi:hypothetical protein
LEEGLIPTSIRPIENSYTLACGLALGTINLCLCESTGTDKRRIGLSDLRLEERLIRYVIGGIDKGESDRPESPTIASTFQISWLVVIVKNVQQST